MLGFFIRLTFVTLNSDRGAYADVRGTSKHAYSYPVELVKTDPSESKGQRKEDNIIMLGWSHSQPLRIRKPDHWFGRECGGELNYPVGPPHDPDRPSRSLSGVQTTSYMLLYSVVWGFDLGHEQISPAHLGDSSSSPLCSRQDSSAQSCESSLTRVSYL